MKSFVMEVEEAEMENIPIYENHVPKEFIIKDGKLRGMLFEKVKAEYSNGKRKFQSIQCTQPNEHITDCQVQSS